MNFSARTFSTLGALFFLFCLGSACANEILVPLPPDLPPGLFGAHLENRSAVPRGSVQVTLRPYMPDIYFGSVTTRIVDDVLEVRMRYTNCYGDSLGPCPLIPQLTLEFEAPKDPGVYPVRIFHVSYEAFLGTPRPDLAMLMGTDVLTVRNPAEPIPTLDTWSRIALVLVLAGGALALTRRAR